MKKVSIVLFLLAFFFGVDITHATVGGPTLVSDLKYNPQDSSVYFVEQSFSGRGCPPTLNKMSVVNLAQRSTVLSCDDLQSLSTDEAYGEIYGVIAGYKDLTPIHLTDNGITIDVAFVREEKIGDDWVIKSNFIASISQNGKIVSQYPISGCNKDQPFTFAGYAIPSLTKKFVLLLSTKGDCFEGGYTNETLYIVNGDVINRAIAGNSFKGRNPLVPSEATLVVFEKSKTNVAQNPSPTPTTNPTSPLYTTSPTDSTENKVDLMTALIAGAFLIIGVALGYHANKK